jgi:hypothetical protein
LCGPSQFLIVGVDRQRNIRALIFPLICVIFLPGAALAQDMLLPEDVLFSESFGVISAGSRFPVF